jgi:hypothetical protein
MNDDNLKSWKKGESGNSKGRPKGSPNVTTVIDRILNKEIELDDPIVKKRVKKKLIEHGIARQALRWLNGDNVAGKDILDRRYGKAHLKTTLEVTGIDLNKVKKVDTSKMSEEEIKKLFEDDLNKINNEEKK